MDTGNVAEAARAAGYTPSEEGTDNARQVGHRLFNDPKVKDEIDALVEQSLQEAVFLVPLAAKAVQAYLSDTSDPKRRKSQADLGAKILQDFRSGAVKPQASADITDSQLIDELLSILGNDPALIAEIAKRATSAATGSIARAPDTQADEPGKLLEAVSQTGAILRGRKKVPAKNVPGGEPHR